MAKTLADYPVSYPYGATSWPYSQQFPHHGDDIAAPSGTDIVIWMFKLGEVGSTGDSTGPHTHVDKSKNLNGGPYVKPSDWKTITGVVVFAGDLGTAGLTVIVEADNGYFYRFLHMSKINVKIGDKIGGDMPTLYKTQAEVANDYKAIRGSIPPVATLKYHVGRAREAVLFSLGKEVSGQRDKLAKELKNLKDNPPVESEVEKSLERIIAWVKSKWNKE